MKVATLLGFGASISMAVASPINAALAQETQGFKPNAQAYQSVPAVPFSLSLWPADVQAEFDLSRDFPIVGDQKGHNSCVAWAVAYSVGSYVHKKNKPANPQIFSPSFVYNRLTSNHGTCSEMLELPKALGFVVDTGLVPLVEFPYDGNPGGCARQPTEALLKKAAAFKLKDFYRINPQNLSELRTLIQTGNPIIAGINISASLSNPPKGVVVTYDAPLPGVALSPHAMVIVGYSDKTRAFKFMNSRGPQWGDDGFVWIDYDTFQQNAIEAYVVPIDPTIRSIREAEAKSNDGQLAGECVAETSFVRNSWVPAGIKATSVVTPNLHCSSGCRDWERTHGVDGVYAIEAAEDERLVPGSATVNCQGEGCPFLKIVAGPTFTGEPDAKRATVVVRTWSRPVRLDLKVRIEKLTRRAEVVKGPTQTAFTARPIAFNVPASASSVRVSCQIGEKRFVFSPNQRLPTDLLKELYVSGGPEGNTVAYEVRPPSGT